MKKIYQNGFIAALVALLPAGMLLAGNGDSNGTKKSISIDNSAKSSNITITIHTDELYEIGQVDVISTRQDVYIKDIHPTVDGIDVDVDIDPNGTGFLDPDNDVIIIEIVGVDNITGVDAADGNNGNSIPTNIVFDANKDEGLVINNNDGNNFQGNLEDPNDFNPTQVFSANKNDINIFPNPVIDQTSVVTVGEILGRSIEIMDLSGNIVMNMRIGTKARQTTLDLSMLHPGLYILNYTSDDGKIISKRIQKV